MPTLSFPAILLGQARHRQSRAGRQAAFERRPAHTETGAPPLPEALKASRGAAVPSMNGGVVSRQLMQMAAADMRALFGGGKGDARITCLLAIADLQGLAGLLAPIRLATSEGTIEGFGQIDLLKRWLDVTIRSEPSTTSSVALDTPIRIHGGFDKPSVLPAIGTFDRARLTGPYALNRLPPDLQLSAGARPCIR